MVEIVGIAARFSSGGGEECRLGNEKSALAFSRSQGHPWERISAKVPLRKTTIVSRLRGNAPVRFLGVGVMVMSLAYRTTFVNHNPISSELSKYLTQSRMQLLEFLGRQSKSHLDFPELRQMLL